jgi:L-lactate utilization protein LutC
MLTVDTNTALVPNKEFTRLATEERIARVVKALEANGMKTLIVETGEEAKKLVLEIVPQGVEVYANQSQTLDKLGLREEFDGSGRYNAVRPKVLKLDRKTQADEIRKLRSAPDYIIGSVHAITENGQVMASSFGGSQLGAYAYGSAKVIWIVGTQKLVKDLDEGFRRIEEYSYPLEDARLLAALGIHSAVGKTLIVNREVVPGRITIILVKEELGY